MSGIIELLQCRGLPSDAKTKVVRHKDKRCDLQGLTRSQFETGYQAYQAKPIFNCDYIVSCLGLPRSTARFLGVYRVRGQQPAREVPPPVDFPYSELFFPGGTPEQGHIWYDLVKVDGFEDLEDRVVIDWGPGARSWAQWATLEKDKEIIEMPVQAVSRPQASLAEEILHDSSYSEGAVTRILVNRYERDAAAREACIARYGVMCHLCGFVFADFYGEIARDLIHVHHLRPISDVGSDYQINPVEDLRPVCPNCHAVLHRRDPPYSLDEVRQSVKKNGRWPGNAQGNRADG